MTRKSIDLFDMDDTRGVSPVIGVILMVAITVILAAVIGTFVLGLGENVSQSTPQAQLTLSTTGNNITITHKGGDPITASSIKVKVENTSTGGSTLLFTPGNNTKLTVGDTATVNTSAAASKSKLIWPNGEEPDSVFTDGDTAFTGGLKTGVTYHVTVIHKDSQQLIADQDVIA